MSDREPQPTDRPRDTRGHYLRTRETAERDARAADLRAKGLTYRAIAHELQVDVHSAYDMVQRCLRETVREPAEDVRSLELDRLDAKLERLNALEAAARTVLERAHVTVSHGKIIKDDDDEPLLDDGPVLQAIDRLLRIEDTRLRISESRRKLLGLDAPSRVSVDAEQLGAEIVELLNQTGTDEQPST